MALAGSWARCWRACYLCRRHVQRPRYARRRRCFPFLETAEENDDPVAKMRAMFPRIVQGAFLPINSSVGAAHAPAPKRRPPLTAIPFRRCQARNQKGLPRPDRICLNAALWTNASRRRRAPMASPSMWDADACPSTPSAPAGTALRP